MTGKWILDNFHTKKGIRVFVVINNFIKNDTYLIRVVAIALIVICK